MEIEDIFEQPFDFDSYLEDWILSIEDIEERSFARTHFAKVIQLMIQESERSYQALEQRIYDEISPEDSQHHTSINVVERSRYDITAGEWFSLIPGDDVAWNERRIDCSEAAPWTVDCLFCDAEMSGLRYWMGQSEQILSGRINTTQETYQASFRVKPSMQYKTCLEKLYRLFCENGIPWVTVNAGYLLRFFDLEVIAYEGDRLDTGLIIAYQLDVNLNEQGFRSNLFPVWNITKQYYDSTQFVMPTIDQKYYEHSLQLEHHDASHGYLVESNQDIVSFRHTEQSIMILTPLETFRKWVLYEIIPNPKPLPYAFETPILSNQPKHSFTTSYLNRTGVSLHSKLDIIRFAQQYDLHGIIKLRDVAVLHHLDPPKDQTHLTMSPSLLHDGDDFIPLMQLNWFIPDSFYNKDEQKVLLFQFSSEKQHFLQYDLLSFVMGELQRQFSEYRCEAVWYKGEGLS